MGTSTPATVAELHAALHVLGQGAHGHASEGRFHLAQVNRDQASVVASRFMLWLGEED